jgi:N-acetylmuramoyl-L-alanine amidase
MFRNILLAGTTLLLFSQCSGPNALTSDALPLQGVNITLDPGQGDTEKYDSFRIGPSGEREEWINLRVAKILAKKLRRAGANVHMTRTRDKDVSLGGRAALAKQHKSDLLVSIHHNGSGNDPTMDLPIVYFYGPASLNPASVDFANILISEMRSQLSFEQPTAGAVYSDHLIYSSGTSILRNTIDQMPGVIGEGGFFTNVAGEARLKSRDYNRLEANVYFQAILKFFDLGLPFAEPLLPDSLPYLDLTRTLTFQLDDGFGSSFFEDHGFMVLQDGDTLNSHWDPSRGLLTVQPNPSESHRVSFQVFARNFKGKAMHPKPFTFLTQTGEAYYSEEKWQDAFAKGEAIFQKLETMQNEVSLPLIEEALTYYQLSLDLQIVHPEARQAEEAILVLLIMKDGFSNEDLTDEIADQTRKLREYYPE